jgi:hypothetical protein
MKKIVQSIIALTLVLFSTSIYAQISYEEGDGDTSQIRIGDWEITVSEDDDVFEIDRVDNLDRNTRTRWFFIDFGVNALMNGENSFNLAGESEVFSDLRYGRSLHLDMHMFRQRQNLIRHVLNLEYGLTFSWQNFSFQDDIVITPNAEAFSFEFSEEALKKSKLSMTYLSVPIGFVIETNPSKRTKSLRIAGGMRGGVRIASRTKIKTEDRSKTKQKDDFNLNAFQYGPYVRLGYGWFNLYAMYAMSDFFQQDEGPELHSAVIGVSFGMN